MEHHPHRRLKCPVCQAVPGEACTDMSYGVSHWDRVHPPWVADAFWMQWEVSQGFLPIRFAKACLGVRRYYRELRG